MKYYLSIFLTITTLVSFAQQPKINNINEVKTLNIYGGNNKTVIGKIIVNQTLQTKIFLINYSQTKDSSGIYTTIINLGNNENVPLFGGNISLYFDKPVISAEGSPLSSGMNILTSLDANKMNYSFKAAQINQPFEGNILISFVIKSTQKTLVTIKGIDGVLNN